MKKLYTLLIAVAAAITLSACQTPDQPQLIVVGNGNRAINIIDMETKESLWHHDISYEDRKCNSVILLADGEHIAYSTLGSAQVVSLKSNEVVWEYRPEGAMKSAEIHSVVSLGKEGFAVFIAKEPVSVMEVSLDFKTTKMVEFKNFKGAKNPHGMFRLVSLSKEGDYIFRWSPDGLIYRVSRTGEVIDTYDTDEPAFAISELEDGDLIFGTGDNGQTVVYDPDTKSIVHKITSFSMNGVSAWIQCMGQALRIDEDRYLVTNWVGHQTQQRHMINRKDFIPVLMVVDGTGEILWHYTLEDAVEQLNLTLGATGFYYSKKPIIK